MVFFITGASSFIGIELCHYLSDNGHEVIAMTRRANGHLDEIAKDGRLNVFIADLQTLAEVSQKIRADVFVHLAWAGTTHEERNNPTLHEDNVRLSLECVKTAKRMGCKLYVDAGSQAEYGIVPGVITEDISCNPFSAYGKGKLKMYQESSRLTKELGLKYIHLRILSVYGENDHEETLIQSVLKRLKANEPIEMCSGGQKWNYVYVKDAARQIASLSINAMKDNIFCQEIYNIASNDTRTLQEFIIAMKEVTGSTSSLKIGGYNPEKDVNLEPNTAKTSAIVDPLTRWRFEERIEKMFIKPHGNTL